MTSEKLTPDQVREQVLKKKLFVIIGDHDISNIGEEFEMCESIYRGGGIPEISFKIPNAAKYIKSASDFLRNGECVSSNKGPVVIAAGSIQNLEELDAAIDAGADAAMSVSYGNGGSHDSLAFIRRCKERNVFSVPSAMTPGEISYLLEQPKETGPDAIKIFPASVYGPKVLKDLLVPMVRKKHEGKIIMPAGGVNLNNCNNYASSVISNGFNYAMGSSFPIQESLAVDLRQPYTHMTKHTIYTKIASMTRAMIEK
jgi:2-keto-3-deoxy-6-phosphogluconate aldolase